MAQSAQGRPNWWTAWWQSQLSRHGARTEAQACHPTPPPFAASTQTTKPDGLPATPPWSASPNRGNRGNHGQEIAASRRAAAASNPDHDHDHIHGEGDELCAALPPEAEFLAGEGLTDNANLALGSPLAPLDQTFRLHSNPGASKTIYLDFNGHTTTGTSWNNSTMGSSFYSPAFSNDSNRDSFSDSELTLIQRVWQRVAADFAAFDVNITTQAPPTDWLIKSSSTDPNYGIRVVITNYGPSSSTAGGIAYINSFNWDTDTPTFVYNTSLLGISEAVSHEVGHTLGLSHDGTSSVTYYQGHGSGETGWAPIMGVGYYKSVTTWDNGTYYLSNNGGSSANYSKGADDLSLITSNNGFSYLSDLEGSSLASATPLSINAGKASQFGTIQTATDTDWFRFDLSSSGGIDLKFDPYVYSSFLDSDGLWGGDLNPYFATVSDASTGTSWADNGTNLDLWVGLYNSTGVLLASSNPTGLGANLVLNNLDAGTYFLQLDGVGFGSPTSSTPTGYSDYASIGNYLISGSITASDSTPVITLAVNSLAVSEDGDAPLVFTFTRSSTSSEPLTVNYTLTGTASSGSDYATLASPGSVTFAADARTATVVVDPIADTGQEADETVLLTLQPGDGYRIGTSTAVSGRILDDDGPVITAALNLASVAENSGTPLVYTFSRSGSTSAALSFDVHLGGTTTLGSDYSLGSGASGSGTVRTLSFAAGSATTTLSLNPTNDTLFEYSESLELTLVSRSGYRVGTTQPLVAQITPDGDLPAISLAVSPSSVTENGTSNITYTFSRTGDFSQPLTVSYSVGGTATPGVDYTGLPSTATTQTITFAANASTATRVLDPQADITAEGNETVSFTLLAGTGYTLATTSAVTATITNVTPPTVSLAVAPSVVSEQGGGPITYTFTRSVASADPLTVNYAIGGTATNGVDYTTIPTSVTIAANATTATVVVNPVADSLSEGQETVTLTLNPSATASYAVGTSAPVTATISDQTLPLINLSVAPASVAEDGASALVFTFSRNGDPSAALTVNYSVGGSATAATDYTGLSSGAQSLTFAAGVVTATVTVDPTADGTVEANETVSLTLADGSGYLVGTSGAVIGTITNDDAAPVLAFTSGADSLTGIAGSADTFVLSRLGDALIGSGTPPSFDRITNLEAGSDRIDTPSTRTTAINPRVLGSVNALTASAIGTVLTSKTFARNGAATFTYQDTSTSGSSITRTFLALNDATAGYQDGNDALIEITGYSGTLGSLAIL